MRCTRVRCTRALPHDAGAFRPSADASDAEHRVEDKGHKKPWQHGAQNLASLGTSPLALRGVLVGIADTGIRSLRSQKSHCQGTPRRPAQLARVTQENDSLTPGEPPGPRTATQTIYERLSEKSRPNPDTGCIVWTRGTNNAGYGRIWINGANHMAHRVAYELFAPIPDGLVLDHLCRTPACINPNHLEPVTSTENIMRGQGCMADYARRTHCPQGHPYEGENLWLRPAANNGSGARRCRECKHEENRRYRELQKWQRQSAGD